nr:hypothetical protein Iba_chr03bCG4480 [Ipomoea batatas]
MEALDSVPIAGCATSSALPAGERRFQSAGLQIPDCIDKWLHGSQIALISGCTALVSPKSALVARESPVSPKSNIYRSPKLDPRLLPTLSVQDALGRRRRRPVAQVE